MANRTQIAYALRCSNGMIDADCIGEDCPYYIQRHAIDLRAQFGDYPSDVAYGACRTDEIISDAADLIEDLIGGDEDG